MNETIHSELTSGCVRIGAMWNGQRRRKATRWATYFLRKHGKVLVWDVTVVDTFAIRILLALRRPKDQPQILQKEEKLKSMRIFWSDTCSAHWV